MKAVELRTIIKRGDINAVTIKLFPRELLESLAVQFELEKDIAREELEMQLLLVLLVPFVKHLPEDEIYRVVEDTQVDVLV